MRDLETIIDQALGPTTFLAYGIMLSKPGAFALYYPDERKVWIGSGASIAEGITRQLRLLTMDGFGGAFGGVYKQKDQDDIRIVVEYGEPRGAYINLWTRYKSEGYEVLSRSPSIWRLVEVPIRDPRPEKIGYLLALYYVSQSGRRILAGIFPSVAKARWWVKRQFPDPKNILEPFVRGDGLTRQVKPLLKGMG